jgi:chromate transporter
MSTEAAPVSLREATRYWLKLGFISFGGPAGQIALMHQEVVERRRWLSEGRFLHALNYCMLLPGPEAQQLATYIGWLMHRSWGGVIAGGLFVLPSLFILIALAWVYMAFGHVPAVAALFYGIKPAVTAVVLQAAWRVGTRALKGGWAWGVAALAFVGIAVARLPFPVIIFGAAAVGAGLGRWAPERLQSGAGHPGAAAASTDRAWIDEHSGVPAHARWRWPRFALQLAVFALLWALPMAMLSLLPARFAPLSDMGLFFTKAALMTFGGAYAVLPYVFQHAVFHYRWLDATQMIDGLGLGETTPGPLIMVVCFVGFVGGWHAAMFGPEALFLSGALAAAVVTWFTFLPSFAFVLLGGPFIESTHRQPHLAAPMAGITAAVVGVIANLALFFALHVLWPLGVGGRFEWPLAVICAAAAIALLRFRVGVIPVIAASALAGLASRSVVG